MVSERNLFGYLSPGILPRSSIFIPLTLSISLTSSILNCLKLVVLLKPNPLHGKNHKIGSIIELKAIHATIFVVTRRNAFSCSQIHNATRLDARSCILLCTHLKNTLSVTEPLTYEYHTMLALPHHDGERGKNCPLPLLNLNFVNNPLLI